MITINKKYDSELSNDEILLLYIREKVKKYSFYKLLLNYLLIDDIFSYMIIASFLDKKNSLRTKYTTLNNENKSTEDSSNIKKTMITCLFIIRIKLSYENLFSEQRDSLKILENFIIQKII